MLELIILMRPQTFNEPEGRAGAALTCRVAVEQRKEI